MNNNNSDFFSKIKKLSLIDIIVGSIILCIILFAISFATNFVLNQVFDQKYLDPIFSLIDIIITILGFALAIVLAWHEFSEFYRQRKLTKLYSVKNLLTRTHSTLQYINYLINRRGTEYDNLANEAAFSIANQFCDEYLLKSLKCQKSDPDQEEQKLQDKVDKLLKNKYRMKFLHSALLRTCGEVKIKKTMINDLNALKKDLFNVQSDMPVLIAILTECVTLIRSRIILYTTISLFDRPYDESSTPDNNELTCLQESQDLKFANYVPNDYEYIDVLIKQEITLHFKNTLRKQIQSNLLYLLELVQKIVEIMKDFILGMDDAQLETLQTWEQDKFNSRKGKEFNLEDLDPDFQMLRNLVVNWMFYEEQSKKYSESEFQFKLGCLEIRRILNRICEERKNPRVLEAFIDRFLEELSMSSGTSERDNIEKYNS